MTYYQVITHEDNYYDRIDETTFEQVLLGDAKWYREIDVTEELQEVSSEMSPIEDISTGQLSYYAHSFEPKNPEQWTFKVREEKPTGPLSRFLVVDEVHGNYKLDAFYVSDHTFDVIVTVQDSGVVLRTSVDALIPPIITTLDPTDYKEIINAAVKMIQEENRRVRLSI